MSHLFRQIRKKRKGIHSKNKSKHAGAKTFVKPYNGQGRNK